MRAAVVLDQERKTTMPLLDKDPATILATGALALILVLAVREDLRRQRIPNALSFGGLAVGVAIQTLAFNVDGFLLAIAGVAVGLVCLLPLYLVKGMGAGDVKLMAAAGAFLGPFGAFMATMLAFVFGALLAVVVVARRAIVLRTAAAAGASGTSAQEMRAVISQAGKERFPYAVAIALGVVATMWMRGMFEPFLRSIT